MKQSQLIKLLSSLSISVASISLIATSCALVSKNNNAVASAMNINDIPWIKRSSYNASTADDIISVIKNDNTSLFSLYPGLQEAITISAPINNGSAHITISADSETYTGQKEWDATCKEEAPASLVTKITYSDLGDLISNNKLVTGQQYQITDYQTTTSTTDTLTADHKLDIIVTATSKNTLSESALVTRNEEDTTQYFDNTVFEAWELKYCFSNDTDRFDWADEDNGKGVIYYMKDEFDNEASYDFKNILFTPYGTTGTPSKYTFDNGSNVDASITGDAYENTIAPYRFIGNTISLNYIVFNGNGSFGNTLDTDCHDMVFGASCTSNKFGKECANNTFCDSCSNNTIGNSFIDNSFKNSINGNTFGNSVTDIKVNAPASGRTLSSVLIKNDFGNGVNHITFANSIQFTKNTILSTGSAQNPLTINANMENKLIVDGKVVNGQGDYAINAVTWNGALPIAGTTAVSNPLVLHDCFGNSISSNVSWKASTIEGDVELYIESNSSGKPILKLIMGDDAEYCKVNLSAYVNDTKVTSIKVTVSPENSMVYDPGDGTDVEVILEDNMDVRQLCSWSDNYVFTTKDGQTITFSEAQRANIKSLKITSVKDGTTTLGHYFLRLCKNMTYLDISGLSEITTILGQFCVGCYALKSIDMSKLTKITVIGDSFFNGASRLTEVKLPASCPIKTIGNYFLENCGALKSIDLSGFTLLTSIGTEFLYGDTSLTRIDLPDTSPTSITVSDYRFMTSVPTNIPMYARADLVGDYDAGTGYKGTAPWNTRHEQIVARP